VLQVSKLIENYRQGKKIEILFNRKSYLDIPVYQLIED